MPRTAVILCTTLLLVSRNGMSQAPVPAIPPFTVVNRPFSPGIQLAGAIYLSGHLGLDPATGRPPAEPSEEARQVMRSVQSTLAQGGLTMDDLVYVEIYCTDLSLYGAFNQEYVSFFHKPYPARDFIGVKDLLFGARFEVMGIAVRHASQNKKQLTKSK